MLGWESGLALGIGIGYACFDETNPMLLVAGVLTVAALAMYNYYTHNWFLTHKNR